MNKKRTKTYDRVMSRVSNRSRSSFKSDSYVTRHESPSSVCVGAKVSSSNLSAGVYKELPAVLNDYVPESSRESVRKSNVVRPRRTVKSMDTARSPPRSVIQGAQRARRRAPEPIPAVASRVSEGWSDSHVKSCYSSRSHSKLKELKDEIKAYREKDKMIKWRSSLYKKCGVVLDDAGQLAADKAVQADGPESGDGDSR